MKKQALLYFTAAALSVASLAGCSTANTDIYNDETSVTFAYKKDPVTVNAFKLDTYVSIAAYADIDEDVLAEILDLCDYYEDMFSMHKEDSALYKLNANVTNKVPHELGIVMKKALEWSVKSEGGFQISVGRLTGLWDFTSGSHFIPDGEAIKKALETIDDSKISVYPEDADDPSSDYIVEKPDEMQIDMGAVAKGFIADKLKEELVSRGIESAVINLGGNVLCVGDKNGKPYKIGIRKPFADDTDMLLVLELKDCSAVTSGVSERYFEENGHIYHHILNPKTGYPYENGLWQTTIVSEDSLSGDILSTLCFALGPDKAIRLCADEPDTEIILVKDDLSITKSNGADNLIK